MTLVELERLIRRIEEAMERPTADGVLPRLAGDYAAVCRAAAQRLNQCAAMLAAGDEHQAVQLAEAAPALLDQLTLVSFRRSPNFRTLCQSQNLPTPENFDIKAIRQLNDLYAKGIDKDHAFYREYRRAIMVNDDARALSVLRSITRLNATDKNAATELARLEHKFRADKVHRLERLVRDKAAARDIADAAEELENIAEAEGSAAWIPAQIIRGSSLVGQAREAQRTAAVDDLREILSKIPAVAHLLTTEDRKTVEELSDWSAADAARRKEAANRRNAIIQLTETVARIEQEQIAPGGKSLTDLRRSADSLERAWRQVEQFRAEIAGDVAARAQKLRDTVRLQIDRRLRASRRVAFAGVALVVVLCFGAAWFAYSRQAANSLAHRIEVSIQQRRVADTKAAIAPLQRQMLKTHQLQRAHSAAILFLNAERELKAASDKAIAAVAAAAAQNFTNAPPSTNALLFHIARNANAALAPEFRSSANATLAPHENWWRDLLDRQRTTSSGRLAQILVPIESAAERDLQYSRNPTEAVSSAESLKRQLEAARPIVDAPISELRPKQEELFRFENLKTRIEKFARDATNSIAAQNLLTRATNLAGYNNALQLIAANGFTPEPQRASATALMTQGLSDRVLLAPLLLPNGPASALSEPVRVSRVPDEILPTEREIQRRLREDENIHNVSRLEIEVKSLPPEDPRRRRTVFLRGELQRRITRRAGQIHDPIENPSALRFESKEMSSLEYSVEEPARTPERDLYDRAGLGRLIDSNTGKYQVSLLMALDEINQDRRASPLFRAWLFLRICDITDAQPVEWGAIWSPSFAADRGNLDRLGAREINTGDWFVPAANTRRSPALNAHFDRAAVHSYSREAAFFKQLLPKAAAAGVRVIGHINANGEPVINDTRAYHSVFALTTPTEPAQLLFNSVSPNDRSQPLVRAIPFSPLFVIAGNANDLVNSTLQTLGYSIATVNAPESLPPILRTTP